MTENHLQCQLQSTNKAASCGALRFSLDTTEASQVQEKEVEHRCTGRGPLLKCPRAHRLYRHMNIPIYYTHTNKMYGLQDYFTYKTQREG